MQLNMELKDKSIIEFAIDRYKSGISMLNISKEIGVPYHTVRNTFKNYASFIREKNARVYNLNLNYFENIDTAEKSYWVGFLSGDGCVDMKDKSKTPGRISLELKRGDRNHIQKFLDCIDSNIRIKDCSRYKKYTENVSETSRIFINSVKMAGDLIRLGVVPNKSKFLKVCENIPDKFIVDYWRGLVDSDGWMCGSSRFSVGLIGTENIVTNFKFWVRSICPDVYDIKLKHKRNSYSVEFTKKSIVFNVLKKLYYESSVSLDRKKIKSEEIIQKILVQGF